MAPKRECAKNAQAPKEKKVKLMENDTGEAKTKGAKKKRPTRAKKGKPMKNSREIPEEFQDDFQEEFQDGFKEEFGHYTMGKLNYE